MAAGWTAGWAAGSAAGASLSRGSAFGMIVWEGSGLRAALPPPAGAAAARRWKPATAAQTRSSKASSAAGEPVSRMYLQACGEGDVEKVCYGWGGVGLG